MDALPSILNNNEKKKNEEKIFKWNSFLNRISNVSVLEND